MPSSLIDKDNGWKGFVSNYKKTGNSYTKVGYFVGKKTEPARTKGGARVDVVTVAAAQEFGTNRIPSRSFMRTYLDENPEKISQVIQAQLVKIFFDNFPIQTALSIIGEYVKVGMQRKIDSIYSPKLADSTIKARMRKISKLHTKKQMTEISQKPINEIIKPLVDTGTMRNSLTHKEFIV